MGFASASREEKLKMMKTSRTRKLTRKLNKLGNKKKVSRAVVDKLKDIKAGRSKDSRKRATNVEDDWVADREAQFDDENEDVLPLDMLDADIDWENSAFANVKRRHDAKLNEESDEDDGDIERKKRKFDGQLEDNMEEMLPIKLQDGRVLRPTREKAEGGGESEQEEEEAETEEKEQWKPEDFSSLSAPELIAKRQELLYEAKEAVSTLSSHLLANPQENIVKLRELLRFCLGNQVHPLIRENVQKVAIASTVQVFIDIVPGYAIRQQSEEEKQQKQKKETRKLMAFEESLLLYYLKFLQLLEKLCGKFMVKDRQMEKNTFSYKIGMLSLKALARLCNCCSHFNYTTNIISTMVRMSLCKDKEVVSEVCGALSNLFKEDVHLKMSLFGARSISTLVTKKKGRVPAPLIATFLQLNIKEVKNEDKKSEKGRVFAKRAMIKKEKANKTARKYKRQLEKLEADMKELDEAESVSAKLKNATEAMKYVFQTYFSVLKRMPNLDLLEPVLEGLSKFAHLLGVEFFDDIIATMEDLVDKQHLRIIDQLNCINTVFVMLMGEGQLLNVDPSKFYRSVYRIMNILPFEIRHDLRIRQLTLLTRTLDLMVNHRRKQVPLQRVAAFCKRLSSIACVMDDHSAACILALLRSFFIAHPKLISLAQDDEEGGAGTFGGIYRPEINDPDVCNAMGAGIRKELKLLSKRRFKPAHQYANNLLHGVPSTGLMRIGPEFNNKPPSDMLHYEVEEETPSKVDTKYLDQLKDYCKKKHLELTPQNSQFHIQNWLEGR